MLALAEMVRELARSDSPIKFVERPVDDPTVRQPDISLARTEMGWDPQVPVRLGLRRTISWFRGHQDLITATGSSADAGRLPGGTPASEQSGTPAPEQSGSEPILQRQPA